MIDTAVRARLQPHLFDPLARVLAARGLTPTMITAAALLLGIATPVALYVQLPILAVILLWLSGLSDVLDGSMARLSQQDSPLGCVLDIVSDRVVEAAVVLGLYVVAPVERAGLCLLMLSAILICVTSFLVVSMFLDEESEKSFSYSPGLIERVEAFLFFTAMMLVPSAFTVLAILFTGLVFLTASVRLYHFTKQ